MGLIIITPIWLPNASERFFLGAVLSNSWHNPTYMAVKGIGIWLFFMVFWGIEKLEKKQYVDKKYWLVIAILGVISEILKPSFMQAFLPTLVIWVGLVFLKRKSIREYMPLLCTITPSILYIFYQYIVMIGETV